MAIKVGNKEVANITVGSTPVKSVYKGSTKIWPSESWHTIFDTERTWTGSYTTSTPIVFASTTNESKKFRITYKGNGSYVTIYKNVARNPYTEYTDTFEISDTGTIIMIEVAYIDFSSDAESRVKLLYNVSTKEFSAQLKKIGDKNTVSLTIYKIEQFF